MKASPRVLAGALLWSAVLACGRGEQAGRTVESGPKVRVRVQPVVLSEIPELAGVAGTTQAYSRVLPGTRLMGRIVEVPCSEGEWVAKGAVLARLDSQDLTARRRQAQAAVDEAQAVLVQAERDLARSRGLRQDQALTQQALDEAETGVARARAAASAAAERLRELDAEIRYTTVTSPVAGVVVETRVEVGDVAVPGAPMFVVEQQDPIKIAVELGERELAQVRVGQPAEVEIAGMAGAQRRAGTVEAVIPAVDPGTRTFQVQVVVPNPDRAIGSGAFARVRFAGRGRPALLVPASALVRQGQLEGVYVVSHGRALLRWVRVGAARGEQAEVLSGLEAGDLVVVEPRPDLRDGSAVEVGGDA